MKALRLPTGAPAAAYWFASAAHVILLPFVFASPNWAKRSWRDWRLPPGPGFGCRSPAVPTPHVDANRISQVSRRSILCLCSAPRPRSNRCALALAVTSVLPPYPERRRLRTMVISGLTHAASSSALLRFALRVATRAQGWLPAGWLASTGRGSNPLDRCERFQIT
jgi:hypothetical protein